MCKKEMCENVFISPKISSVRTRNKKSIACGLTHKIDTIQMEIAPEGAKIKISSLQRESKNIGIQFILDQNSYSFPLDPRPEGSKMVKISRFTSKPVFTSPPSRLPQSSVETLLLIHGRPRHFRALRHLQSASHEHVHRELFLLGSSRIHQVKTSQNPVGACCNRRRIAKLRKSRDFFQIHGRPRSGFDRFCLLVVERSDTFRVLPMTTTFTESCF